MRQTTKNLIRGVGVAAAIALPLSVGPLVGGISKAIGHPLLDEGRDVRPKVVAQLSVPSEPKSKTSYQRAGELIGHSDTRIQIINSEMPQEEPKEKSWFNTPGRVAGAVFVISLIAIGFPLYIRNVILNPGRRLQLRAAKLRQEAEQSKTEPESAKQKGDSQ